MKILMAILFLLMLVNSAHAQWQQITPTWGYGSILCFHERYGEIYAGTQSSGVFVTKDKGITWIQRNKGLTSYFGITSITSDRNNTYASIHQAGIFFCVDGDEQWRHLPSQLDTMIITSIKFSNNSLYAATINQGIFVSTDKGNTWLGRSKGLEIDSIIAIDVLNNTIAIGTPNCVFISIDSGNTWQKKLELTNRYVSDVKIIDTRTVAVLGDTLYVSNNLGENWNAVVAGRKRRARTQSMYVDSKGALYYEKDGFIMISSDKCKTWEQFGIGNIQPIKSLCVVDSSILASDIIQDLYISNTRGKAWYNVRKYPDFKSNVFSTESKMFNVYNQLLYVSENHGIDWSLVKNLSNYRITSKVLHSGDTIICGSDEKIFYSSNAGGNWIFFDIEGTSIRPLALLKDSLIISTNNGNQKICLKNNCRERIILTHISSLEGNILPFGSALLAFGNNEVYISLNKGKSWKNIEPLSDMGIHEIFSVMVNGDATFVLTKKGTYYTNHTSPEWKILKIDTDEVFKDMIANKGHLYIIGSKNNIYVSSDNGNNWETFDNTNLPVSTSNLSMDNTYMYAMDGSLHRYLLNQQTSIFQDEEQNILLYPNPADNIINIKFEDKLSCKMFSIVNVLGQNVLSGDFPPSVDSYTLRLNSLAVGSYTLIMINGNDSVIRKGFLVSR